MSDNDQADQETPTAAQPKSFKVAWPNLLSQTQAQRDANASALAVALARIQGYVAEEANYQAQIRQLTAEVGELRSQLAAAEAEVAKLTPPSAEPAKAEAAKS